MMTGQEMREARLELKLSGIELATICGMSREHISRMEHGTEAVEQRVAVILMLLLKNRNSVNTAVAYGRAFVEARRAVAARIE
jgi:transcriptional regulator with XRE-family HTH domain